MDVDKIIEDMTLQEKINLIGGCGMGINKLERFGIPSVMMADGPTGIRGGKSTALVASVALAATWNRELAGVAGNVVGKECRERNTGFILGPGVNICRLPQNGRNFEYMGEDPYLCSELVVPYIEEVQKNDVIATVKHYAANNQDYDRHRGDSIVSERALREIYLPAFEAAVKRADVGAIMTAYNYINGEHASAHKHLLIDILYDEWGFDGLVMTDWLGSYNTELMCKHGVDLEMPTGRMMNEEFILPLIESGKVSVSDIDKKVKNIISTCDKYGVYEYSHKVNLENQNAAGELIAMLENDGEVDEACYEQIDYDAHHETVLTTAREGIVLLQNREQTLPLNPATSMKVAVVGSNAVNTPTSGGGAANLETYRTIDNLQAIKDSLPNSDVEYVNLDPVKKMLAESSLTKRAWNYELFNNRELSGEPVSKGRCDFAVNNFKDLGCELSDEQKYSARWTVDYTPENDESLLVALRTGILAKVIINNEVVIDAWNRLYLPAVYDYFVESFSANYSFEKGNTYKITVEMAMPPRDGDEILTFDFAKAADMSSEYEKLKSSDFVIASVGYNSFREGEGQDRDFDLLPIDQNVMDQAVKYNDNVITIINAGGAVNMTPWVEKTKAIIMAWYLGQSGGEAIADIITGKYNPSAKLPVSFAARWEDEAAYGSYDADTNTKVSYNYYAGGEFEPVPEYYNEDIFVGYRHFDTKNVAPLFEFGFGLSYTTFEYSNLKLSKNSVIEGETVEVSVDITNSGDVDGAEIVQLYINDVECSVPRPTKELKNFDKVFLKAGESKTVNLTIETKDLSFFHPEQNKWIAEQGAFNVLIGASSRDIRLEAGFELA